ncbi:BrnT family toxin [Ancylobacter moscoviensis]
MIVGDFIAPPKRIDTPTKRGYKKITDGGLGMSGFYEWDPNKEDASRHGVPFAAAEAFEWETAIEARDTRRPYAEVRTVAVGFIDDRLHVMVFSRRAEKLRIISLRKANKREIARYADLAP